MNFRTRVLTITALVGASLLGAGPASASVVLPYNYTIDWINSGSGGVDSTVFRTANQKICVSYNFKVKALTTGGAFPDLTYTIRLYKHSFLGGTLTRSIQLQAAPSTTAYSYGKTCWTGLENNADYYMNWNKSVSDTGSLNGYGTISTS